MIWALLYFYFFGSSTQSLVADLSKPVKAQVQDEAKAKQIIAINKAMRKADADLAKAQKAAGKDLAKLHRDRQAPEAAFLAIHTALEAQRAEARKEIVAGRFQMKDLMTAEQWQAVNAPAPAK